MNLQRQDGTVGGIGPDGSMNVNVTVSVGDVKVQFSGAAESVLQSVSAFLSKQVPGLDLAKRISLNFAVTELVENYSSFVKITPEGPRVIPDTDAKLSDREVIALQLLASRIAKELGKLSTDGLQVSEIHAFTALKPKSVSSRISEFVKAGLVVRDESDSTRYRITTSGIHWLNSTIMKKFKS